MASADVDGEYSQLLLWGHMAKQYLNSARTRQPGAQDPLAIEAQNGGQAAFHREHFFRPQARQRTLDQSPAVKSAWLLGNDLAGLQELIASLNSDVKRL